MELMTEVNKLPKKRRTYFKWKHGLETSQWAGRTEEEIMQSLGVKTLDAYERWEMSPEYQYLVGLLIQSRIGRDLEEIYTTTSEKARSGDEKAVKLLFEIQKQISANNKELKAKKPAYEDSKSVYDDLEL